ncbi:hypothetical protein ABTL20_22210, partial [Acinetobacter baumannii]
RSQGQGLCPHGAVVLQKVGQGRRGIGGHIEGGRYTHDVFSLQAGGKSRRSERQSSKRAMLQGACWRAAFTRACLGS